MPITYTSTSLHKRRRLSSSPPPSPPPRFRAGSSSPCPASSSPRARSRSAQGDVTPPTSPTIHHLSDEDPEKEKENGGLKSNFSASKPPTSSNQPARRPLTTLPLNSLLSLPTAYARQQQKQQPRLSLPTNPLPKAKKLKQRLTQTTLNLTPSLLTPNPNSRSLQMRTCPKCGMHYNTTQSSDRRMHEVYCASDALGRDEGGVGVRIALGSLERKGLGVNMAERGRGGGRVVEIALAGARGKVCKEVLKCLRLVEGELGAASLPVADLTAPMSTYVAYLHLQHPSSSTSDGDDNDDAVTGGRKRKRKRSHEDGGRCTGFLLTERIDAGRLVSQDDRNPGLTMPRPRTTGDEEKILGISRIWTASQHRGRGIASALLDVAYGAFCSSSPASLSSSSGSGVEEGREQERRKRENVAFSQPTESGAALARRWSGIAQPGSQRDGVEGGGGKTAADERAYLVYL